MQKRETSIDLMKGILVLFMIIAHIIQFFPLNGITNHFSNYVDLTTFSGFMFTFGYVCYKAYISKNINNQTLGTKLCLNFFKTLVAYYISGIAFFALILNKLTLENLLCILTLKKIPGYSEFLLSFAFLYLIIFIFKKYLVRMSTMGYVIVCIISLLMTFINYDLIKNPFAGVILGTTSFCCFPILQYSSYFFVGMYFSQYKKESKWITLFSFLGTLAFFVYCISYQNLPSRFPPSILWITGGYAFILLYYYLCQKFSSILAFTQINKVGNNTLVYLVVSNIFIFSMTRLPLFHFDSLSIKRKLFFYVICFFGCLCLSYVCCKLLNMAQKIIHKN